MEPKISPQALSKAAAGVGLSSRFVLPYLSSHRPSPPHVCAPAQHNIKSYVTTLRNSKNVRRYGGRHCRLPTHASARANPCVQRKILLCKVCIAWLQSLQGGVSGLALPALWACAALPSEARHDCEKSSCCDSESVYCSICLSSSLINILKRRKEK